MYPFPPAAGILKEPVFARNRPRRTHRAPRPFRPRHCGPDETVIEKYPWKPRPVVDLPHRFAASNAGCGRRPLDPVGGPLA